MSRYPSFASNVAAKFAIGQSTFTAICLNTKPPAKPSTVKIIEVTNVDFSLAHFLAPLMRGARARGHEVIGVCADGPLLAPIRAEGFRIETPPLVRGLSPSAQARAYAALLALFRAEKPDLVHAHMPISGFLARLAARAAGVPRVAYTCHGFLFNQPAPWPRRAASLAMELARRAGDRHLHRPYRPRKRPTRAPAHRPRPGRHRQRARPGHLPPRRRRARAHPRRARAGRGRGGGDVHVSRLVRHKGYPELLAAMAQLPADMPAHLVVVGTRLASDHGPDMAPDFAASGLGARLRRLGYRTDVAAVLAASDIFALPSHFEGLPMSVIEAMLTALPVVATDIRGPREQVVDGVTGLLVPAAATGTAGRRPRAPGRGWRGARADGGGGAGAGYGVV